MVSWTRRIKRKCRDYRFERRLERLAWLAESEGVYFDLDQVEDELGIEEVLARIRLKRIAEMDEMAPE